MNQHLQLGGWLLGSSTLVALTLAQPAYAQTVITNVEVESTEDGIELILETRAGDRPQIFTINRDNTLTADIISTQLDLDSGNGFRQENPAPGIAAIEVRQLDANSVRVIAIGVSAPPAGNVSQENDNLIFAFTPSGDVTAQAPTTPAPTPVTPAAIETDPEMAPALPPQNPNVLVPNPEITIDGVPVPRPQPQIVPPFLPRAVAPPLGDISVSTVNTTPDLIDLGTDVRVPRLVLRDAPAREVLSLLARAASLNLAYTNVTGTDAAAAEGEGPLITLDLEDEPVQNAFNTVLRITGLQASMIGRTIFVGPRLPDNARDVLSRTFRLNQVASAEMLAFLSTLGAESQQLTTVSREIVTVDEEGNPVTTTEDSQEITINAPTIGEGTLPLRGLTASGNVRLNTVTLVGTPRQLEMATAYIQQLDLRQRQVAVNVKIVDVNLLNTQDFNTSFSFGIGDSYFSIDRGNATVNYGDLQPPNATAVRNGFTGRPTVANPFSGADPFFDPSGEPFGVPGTLPDTVVVNPDGSVDRISSSPGQFFPATSGITDSPFQTGITDITLADDTVITFDPEDITEDVLVTNPDGTTEILTRVIGTRFVPNVALGTAGEVEISTPSFVQYSRDFLASLQAQIVNGNAKILTDPTLIIQEGQIASVRLAEQVITDIQIDRTITAGVITEDITTELEDAGLNLSVQVDRIDDNGFISMQINPTVTAPAQDVEIGEGTITLLTIRQLQSGVVRLRDGQTLILSGIIQDSDRAFVSKVPILGDLPIIGSLFRSTSRENSRQEVIVLVTPSILDDSDQAIYGYGYTPGRQVQEVLQQR